MRHKEPVAYHLIRIGYFLLRLVGIAGSTVAVLWWSVTQACAEQVHSPALSDGPSPAAQTTANMPQAGLTVHYNRVFMKWLAKTFNKLTLCTQFDLPQNSGEIIRNFMMLPLAADTVEVTEGTIGSPEQVSTNYRDIKMGQYGNYTNISDRAKLTSITNDVEELRKILAYQCGFSIDDIIMFFLDYLGVMDPKTYSQDVTQAPYTFTKNILFQMPASLLNADVLPMSDGFFHGSILPALVGDLSLDNSNNSVVDVWKHTDAGQLKLEALQDGNEAPVKILQLMGCHWRTSTNQTQWANWQGSGLTAVSTYLMGDEAMLFYNFPNERHTKLDPRWQNINLWSGDYVMRTAWDPNGYIQAGTGYNTMVGVGPPPDLTSRGRIARAVPQTT